MNSDRKVAVFVSYARSDMDYARRLSQFLRDNNIEVLDDQSVPVGDNFADTLRDEIGRAKSVVVLMSPDYFESRWCQVELAAAIAQEKQILPVRLRGEAEGPLAFLVHMHGEAGPEPVANKIADIVAAP